MDIDLLAKLVKEIALEHDEITLPEVGTFFVELSPAVFSDKGFSMSPPYRKLSFRQRMGSDTLLSEAYSKSAGISPEQASADLEEFLEGLKEILAIRKTVIFPGLGKMRATKENVIFFVPEADLDIYPDGYGLGPLSLRTHGGNQFEVPATEPAVVEQQQDVMDSHAATGSQTEGGAPKHPVLKSMLVVVIVAAAITAALAVLGRVAPEFVDKILYSPEEYRLLHG